MCCSSWGRKELDMTEQLNWTELNLVLSQKQSMILVCFQGKPFNITVIQVYDPTTDAEEAEVDQFFKDLKDS